MIQLTRTVRFCVNPELSGPGGWGRADNTFAAFPSMRGLGRYYEVSVTCRGEVDARTGYFLNIKTIDQCVRTSALPIIERACTNRPGVEPGSLLSDLIEVLNGQLGGSVAALRWHLSPYYSVEMRTEDRQTVLMRQSFEFAASHRLHVPSISDAENRAIFGKCNNPSGHGHNYRVEPCVAILLAPLGNAPSFTLADLERLTNQTLIDRYDHKHLNVDVPEFACPEAGGEGRNPSVENIARACFERLAPVIAAAAPGRADLRSVTVWETDKTSCTYPG